MKKTRINPDECDICKLDIMLTFTEKMRQRRVSVLQNLKIRFSLDHPNSKPRLRHHFAAGALLHRCKSCLAQYLYKLHHKVLQVLRNCKDWEPAFDIHRCLDTDHIHVYTFREVSKKNGVKYSFRGDWNRY